jgi:DNA-binding CsgD family transcriptional regulator
MTTLLERGDALELVSAEVERAKAGSGRLVLFRGPTGIGRSTLLEAAAEYGAAQGMRVLRARCCAEDSGSLFAPVLHLLDPPADFGSDDDTPQTPHNLGYPARLWALARSYAADLPLLLAVDDVHLADPASRRWFTEAARRLVGLPVLLVVTERGQYDISAPSPGLSHGLSPALVRVHTPAPLSRAAAESMVRASFGETASDAWVDGCVRAGAGSPLLLGALLEDLRAVVPDGGEAGSALPESCADLYPGAFVAALSWWLDSAGPETTAVARTLAELEDGAGIVDPESPEGTAPVSRDGAYDTGSLLAGVTAASPARVSGWVTAMTRLGLLRRDPEHGGPRFAHPLLREAVLDGWPQTSRQDVHRGAAEFRHRRGDRAETVAAHLLRMPPTGTARAANTLLDAAAEASRAGRTEDAAGYLRGALDEPMPRELRASALVELGALEFTTARSAGIPRLAEAMRLQDLPKDRVLTALTLGTALARRGEAHAALDILRDLGCLEDDPVLARAVQSATALFSDHDRELRRETYARMRDATERSPALLSPAVRVLLLRYEATAGLVSAKEAMRQLRVLLAAPEDPLLVPYLLGTAAAVAQWADELDDADRLTRAGLSEHRLSPLHPIRGSLLNVRVDTAAARGQYGRVLEYAAENPVRAPGATGFTRSSGPSNVQAHAVMALVQTGRLAEASRLVAEVDVSADMGVSFNQTHDSWGLNRFLYARGVLRAALDDPLGALDDFLECGRRKVERDIVVPVVTPWRSAAAECQLALGRPQEALALAEEEYQYAAVWDTPRVRGRALRVLGEATGGRRGLKLTGEAVESLRAAALGADAVVAAADSLPESAASVPEPRSELRPELLSELIPALISHGRQLTAAGHPRKARPLLREAVAHAERLGAVRHQAAAERSLRDSGARRSTAARTGESALTGSERRVAAFAAEGRTNAEISELLHLARRTVETHLTSTYRKLGIRRRAELPADLAGGGPTSEA